MNDWDEIVRMHGDAVWRRAFRLLGNGPDASDCYQETFIAALEVARRQGVRNWRALLGRLATCKAIDMLRNRFSREVLDGGSGLPVDARSPEPGPDRQAEDAELAESLRAAIAMLPDGQAEVFCLCCMDAMKYREVAGQLGMNTSAVGVALHRARARLRELLSAEVVGREVQSEEVSR